LKGIAFRVKNFPVLMGFAGLARFFKRLSVPLSYIVQSNRDELVL